MKRIIHLSLIAVLVVCSAAETQGQRPTRIRFARGAVSAVVSGRLSTYAGVRTYSLKVKAGQTISTEQVGDHHITVFMKDPRGRSVGDSDASCNNRRSISPTMAGDYRISVRECQKADPWRGRFRFRVSVVN